MLNLISPTSYFVTEKFNVLFFPKKESFSTQEEPKPNTFFLLLFLFFSIINIIITFYALKFACKSGFDVVSFLLAYFFSLPYLFVKLITTK